LIIFLNNQGAVCYFSNICFLKFFLRYIKIIYFLIFLYQNILKIYKKIILNKKIIFFKTLFGLHLQMTPNLSYQN